MRSLSQFAGNALLRPAPGKEAMDPFGSLLVLNCQLLVVVARTLGRDLTDCGSAFRRMRGGISGRH